MTQTEVCFVLTNQLRFTVPGISAIQTSPVESEYTWVLIKSFTEKLSEQDVGNPVRMRIGRASKTSCPYLFVNAEKRISRFYILCVKKPDFNLREIVRRNHC
jgi:hypothetical protein